MNPNLCVWTCRALCGALLALFTGCAGNAPVPLSQPLAAGRVVESVVIRFAGDLRSLTADATVTLPPAQTQRTSVSFALYSDFRIGGVERLLIDGTREVLTVRKLRDESVWGDSFPPNTQWEATAPAPLAAGQPIVLRIRYSGGERSGFGFHLGPDGSFGTLSLWYPSFATPIDASFEYVVPAGYTVVSSGVATGRADAGTEARFSFRAEGVADPTFAVAHYVVRRQEGDVPVSLYLLHDRDDAEAQLAQIRQVLQALEREFGAFPVKSFAVVEMPEIASGKGAGGVSAQGLILTESSYLDQQFNTAFFGHEMSHQWWGVSVKREGDRGMFMLDEALAQYGALRAVDALEGPEAAARFRLRGYPGFSNYLESGLGALMFQAAGLDCPLSTLGPPCASMANYQLSDSKGPLVYDLLAQTVGEEKFRHALAVIAARYHGRSLTWDAFLQEVQTSVAADLGWFYEQWFHRGGAPHLELRWEQVGTTVRCTIAQPGTPFALSVPLVIVHADGSRTEMRMPVAGPRSDASFTVQGRVRTVLMDPQYRVFHSDPALRAEAQALRPWVEGNLHRINGRSAEAATVLRKGLEQVADPDPHGAEFLMRFHLGVIEQQAGNAAAAEADFARAVAAPVRVAEFLPSAYFRLAQLAQTRRDREALREAVRNVRSAEAALGRNLGFSARAQRLLDRAE